MFSKSLLKLSAVLAALNLSAAECDNESADLFCYTDANGIPQNVDIADVQFAASYLRSYGRQTRAGRLFTMNIVDTPDCGEWSLYSHGTVLITAKHINLSVNSSILFEDIATTIDGGVAPKTRPTSILGCGTDGGSLGAYANLTNPAYNSTAYNGLYASPKGILIKVVASGA